MSLTAIILAGGRSTPMKSARPAVLHEVCGKSMLAHLVGACADAGCERIIVVMGQGREQVMAAFAGAGDRRVHFMEQTETLGAAQAIRLCAKELAQQAGAGAGTVLVMPGKRPLIRGQALRTLIEVHQDERAAVSVASAMPGSPSGHARVVRDGEGSFLQVVADADCTRPQREIPEVFAGYCCFRIEDLLAAVSKLARSSKRSDAGLAEILAMLHKMDRKVIAVQSAAEDDILLVQTRQQLAEADEIMQDRIQQRLREGGVSIVSSENSYIEAGVAVGRDSTIRPFSFIGRDSDIGPDCTIGPFAFIPAESIVREGSTVRGNAAEVPA